MHNVKENDSDKATQKIKEKTTTTQSIKQVSANHIQLTYKIYTVYLQNIYSLKQDYIQFAHNTQTAENTSIVYT